MAALSGRLWRRPGEALGRTAAGAVRAQELAERLRAKRSEERKKKEEEREVSAAGRWLLAWARSPPSASIPLGGRGAGAEAGPAAGRAAAGAPQCVGQGAPAASRVPGRGAGGAQQALRAARAR